ncbi:MAG: methyltransferase regulatory domain-containing protein [Alphaproteobacteria bacterium]|nr:methyltransferase regulatory domain-containing protein [Alphaproteobacteria bacterium]
MNRTSLVAAADLAPVRLSYVAALRGVTPRLAGTSFAYAQLGCSNAEAFLCIAASNPEGTFFAVIEDEAAAAAARNMAKARKVDNAFFVVGIGELPKLEYLVYDETDNANNKIPRKELASMASTLLRPSGLFVYRYKAYENADDTLRFVVSEFAPEMNAQQATTFLHEIKALGALYFEGRPIAKAALDNAIKQNIPDQFFAACNTGEKPVSHTFDTMVDFVPAGLSYAGDANIACNYLELSVPALAQDILLKCRENMLYEAIKDFAMQRLERCDIWCCAPINQTANMVALYGGFTFGSTIPRNQIPETIEACGKTVNLRLSPFPALIDLLTTLPLSIGDFLEHPTGAMVSPPDAVGAMQVLVATGIACPMRSYYQGQDQAELTHPKWANGFNSHLTNASVTTQEVLLASPVVGGGVSVSARDALVIQAISRAGMADSIAALLPELARVAKDPALSAKVTGIAEPTAEAAHNMIDEVVTRSLIQWYAYGLLAA